MNPLSSPVVEHFTAKKIDQLPVDDIVEAYSRNFHIDIARFAQSETLGIFECEETGLRFYRGIEPGDGPFYEQLMQHDWYYIPWKWEHEQASTMLHKDDAILEIGCGTGGFLERIAQKVEQAVGLELNEQAVEKCREKGLEVEKADLMAYRDQHRGQFDVLLAFQLMEHIEDVGAFMRAAVDLLKPGGRLIFSVPNNDSFIAKVKGDYLNMPPHHMNLWTAHSIEKTAPHVGCKMLDYQLEPLQAYHQNWYVNAILNNQESVIQKIPKILRGYFYKHAKQLLTNWVGQEADNINGHTILAIYEKT